MEIFMKNGIEVCMPEDDENSKRNMEIAADFMARMIRKYGNKLEKEHEKKSQNENAN